MLASVAVTGGVKLLMEGNGVEVIQGRGKLVSPTEVEVLQADGTSSRLAARAVLVATGARGLRPAVPGGDGTLTGEQALDLTEIPTSLAVIGGGAIGLTFATIFSRLGTSVTVVESGERILPEVDAEIVSTLARELRRQKIQVVTGASLTEIRDAEGDEKTVVLVAGGEETALTAQQVLVADSRQANVEDLGLEAAGVAVGDNGIEVNARMETGVAGVFAAGDVVGEPRLAHVAFVEGKVAVENALSKASEMDYSAVPRCINTVPEIAGVGLTEEEAVSKGHGVRIGRFPLAANGTATILADRNGLVKVVSDEEYGQVLGVHILAPHAADLIGEATLAMKLETTAREIAGAIHTHPTISEAVMEAALDVDGEVLHSMSQAE